MSDIKILEEQVRIEIHSVLCTEKKAIPIKKLHSNYRELMGNHIPYVKLRHRNLESLLRSMPDIVEITTVNNELMVKAIPKAESAHINHLVAGQKAHKPKKSSNNHPSSGNNRTSLQQPNQRNLSNGLLPTPVLGSSNKVNQVSITQNVSGRHSSSDISQHTRLDINQACHNAFPIQPTRTISVHQQHVSPNNQHIPVSSNKESSTSSGQVNRIHQNQTTVSHDRLDHQPRTHNPVQNSNERSTSQSNTPRKGGVDVERLKKIMMQKLLLNRATSPERRFLKDEETQTVESCETLERSALSPSKTDKDCQFPDPEIYRSTVPVSGHNIPIHSATHLLNQSYEAEVADEYTRVSTEPSVSLPTMSRCTSAASHHSNLTSISKLGDTTFVRIIPADPRCLSRNSQRSPAPAIAPVRERKQNENGSYLERLKELSNEGLIKSINLRHLRLMNGRFRAFINVDGYEFSTAPTDFVQYTAAYEEAARRACLHLGNY